MTTILKISLIPLGIIGIALLFQSCANPQVTIEESILVDKTEDSFQVVPEIEPHLKLFEENSNLWEGKRFRISVITDVGYTRFEEATMTPACEMLSSLPERRKESKAFREKMVMAMDTVNKLPAGKTKSVVFFPIGKELIRLTKSEAERKILVAYTDLFENTSQISFYDKKILDLLRTDSDSLKRILEIETPLPDLSGIEIYIVNEPRNTAESADFQTVSHFFRTWLESKNAKVTIGASLSFQ